MAARKPTKKVSSRKPRKTPRKGSAPRKKAARPKRAARKTPTRPKPAAARKAAFGRPGTAGKAEGDATVRRWLKTVKPEHRAMLERIDALIGEVVPDVKRSIKWSMPMYGRAGIGQFASVASFKAHARLSFFSGVHLTPVPPEGESKAMRGVNLRSMQDVDEALFRSWIGQAAAIPGWGKA